MNDFARTFTAWGTGKNEELTRRLVQRVSQGAVGAFGQRRHPERRVNEQADGAREQAQREEEQGDTDSEPFQHVAGERHLDKK